MVRSVSEKTPNWYTGTATVCSSRRSRTSAPPLESAVTVMGYLVMMPLNPAYGPDVIVVPVVESGIGFPKLGPGVGSGVHVTAYPDPAAPPGAVYVKPVMVGGCVIRVLI